MANMTSRRHKLRSELQMGEGGGGWGVRGCSVLDEGSP